MGLGWGKGTTLSVEGGSTLVFILCGTLLGTKTSRILLPVVTPTILSTVVTFFCLSLLCFTFPKKSRPQRNIHNCKNSIR
jgi:hypothetical protein